VILASCGLHLRCVIFWADVTLSVCCCMESSLTAMRVKTLTCQSNALPTELRVCNTTRLSLVPSISVYILQWSRTARKNVCACVTLKFALRTWCQIFRKLSKTQKGSDFDVLPFLWKCKRNNECDNLKTRLNYSLHVQLRSSIMQENELKVTVDKFIV
jgi:hypothetical protein